MFSSKELISFVFVNENDIYYGNDLLKLNLNQYLWKELYGNYKTIYFLSARNHMFEVRSFGDMTSNPPPDGTNRGLFSHFLGGTEQKKFGEWMLRQLRAKSNEAVAFVCSMEDFCTVLDDERWNETLREIVEEKKRSGIFVLTASATADQTSAMLLNSPVFDKLQEKAVTDLRGGELREMYGLIKQSKFDSCLFLNAFTKERIRNVLVHIAIEYPDRCMCRQALDELTEYLMMYLHDPERQATEPLLKTKLPASYLQYRELYEQLLNAEIWSTLVRRCERYIQKNGRRRLQEVCRCPEAPVLRDRKTYAGKCMMQTLPQWLIRREDENTAMASVKLKKIQAAVAVPKNRKENPAIVEAVESFLKQIDGVRENDTETYMHLLNAVEFCVEWIYMEPGHGKYQRVLQIIDSIRSGTDYLKASFETRMNLESCKRLNDLGPVHQKKIEQLEILVKSQLRNIRPYQDALSASMLDLLIPDAAVGKSISGKLEEMTENLTRQPAPEVHPEPVPEPVTIPEEIPETTTVTSGDDFDYDFDDLTYASKPSVLYN